jgi:hypothetical protein
MTPRDQDSVRRHDNVDPDSDQGACGLLRWTSPVVELNLILELYLRELTGRLFRDVQAVYLFGSAVLNDLALAHGDIDLLVVVRRDLGRAAAGEIGVIHRYLAADAFAPWGSAIDASYYPAAMLSDPRRAGEGLRGAGGVVKPATKMGLQPMEIFSLHDHGIVLYGTDSRKTIVKSEPYDLAGQLKSAIQKARHLDSDAGLDEYVSLITAMVRSLYVLDSEESGSKTEATRWFASRLKGKVGDLALEANRLRRGEIKTGIGGLRRGFGDFVGAVEDELVRLEKRRDSGRSKK